MNPPALFRVGGTPSPQGSKVAFNRGGRVVMLEGKAKGRAALNLWRDQVTTAALLWRSSQHIELFDGPLRVVLRFDLARPGGVRTRPYPHVRPDVDKLARAVLDGLTGSLFIDDSRVVDLRALKGYAHDLDDCGVTISCEEVVAS